MDEISPKLFDQDMARQRAGREVLTLIGGHTIRYVILIIVVIALIVYFVRRGRKK